MFRAASGGNRPSRRSSHRRAIAAFTKCSTGACPPDSIRRQVRRPMPARRAASSCDQFWPRRRARIEAPSSANNSGALLRVTGPYMALTHARVKLVGHIWPINISTSPSRLRRYDDCLPRKGERVARCHGPLARADRSRRISAEARWSRQHRGPPFPRDGRRSERPPRATARVRCTSGRQGTIRPCV